MTPQMKDAAHHVFVTSREEPVHSRLLRPTTGLPDEAGFTMSPRNPLTGAGAWPPRRIDYVMVRCPERGGGPTLSIKRCELAFDQPVGDAWASDDSASSQTWKHWREPNDLKPQVPSFGMVASDVSRRWVHTSLGPA